MDTLTIYVGNLPEDVTSGEVRDLFARHGEVVGISLLEDEATGCPRGFGFVTMAAPAAEDAIAALDGVDHRGMMLRVNVARNRGARPPRRAW